MNWIRLVFGIIAGHVVGWILAILWAAATNNLMMPEPVYQERKAGIWLALWFIIGSCTVIGAALAYLTRGGRGRND